MGSRNTDIGHTAALLPSLDILTYAVVLRSCYTVVQSVVRELPELSDA